MYMYMYNLLALFASVSIVKLKIFLTTSLTPCTFTSLSLSVFRGADGEWYAYSFGGYHADDDERTVLEADNSGGPFFKSTPLDVHRFDMGELKSTHITIIHLGHAVYCTCTCIYTCTCMHMHTHM